MYCICQSNAMTIFFISFWRVQDINTATTASRAHGYNLCCSIVALVTVKTVCFVLSFALRMRSASAAGKTADRDPVVRCCSEHCSCLCPAIEVDDTGLGSLGPPPQYGATKDDVGYTSSREKLSP